MIALIDLPRLLAVSPAGDQRPGDRAAA